MNKLNKKTYIFKRNSLYSIHLPEINYFSNPSSSISELLEESSKKFSEHDNLISLTKDYQRGDSLYKFILIRVIFLILSIAVLNIFINQVLEHRYHRFEKKFLEMLNPDQTKQDERLQRFQLKMNKYSPYIKEVIND